MPHICPFKASPLTRDRVCSEADCQLWVTLLPTTRQKKSMCAFQGIFHALTEVSFALKKIRAFMARIEPQGHQGKGGPDHGT